MLLGDPSPRPTVDHLGPKALLNVPDVKFEHDNVSTVSRFKINTFFCNDDLVCAYA